MTPDDFRGFGDKPDWDVERHGVLIILGVMLLVILFLVGKWAMEALPA